MSNIIPHDIGSRYGFMAHCMVELLCGYKPSEKPVVFARLPPTLHTFFQHVKRGSTSPGLLEDMVHYRLARDALDTESNLGFEDSVAALQRISETSMCFLEGTLEPREVPQLRGFFTRLQQISSENYTASSLAGARSSYTFI